MTTLRINRTFTGFARAEYWSLVHPLTGERKRIPNTPDNALLLWFALADGFVNTNENDMATADNDSDPLTDSVRGDE